MKKIQLNKKEKIKAKLKKLSGRDVKRLADFEKIRFHKINLDNSGDEGFSHRMRQELESQPVIKSKFFEKVTNSITKGDKGSSLNTLSAIKAKYGKLSRIILKSGKEYVGAFKILGNGKVLIITTKGKITVQAGKIAKFEGYN